MTLDEALADLALLTDADAAPTLTAADLAMCMRKARRVDAAGLIITNPAWVPTYDLHAAAAAGWDLKAARAAAQFDITADGTTLTRSQVAAACRLQARLHRSHLGGALHLDPLKNMHKPAPGSTNGLHHGGFAPTTVPWAY